MWNKAPLVLSAVIIVFAALIILANDLAIQEEKEEFPERFTLQLFYDGTSSGATRNYFADMLFENGKLASATKSIYIQSGSEPYTERQCDEKLNIQTMALENTKCLNCSMEGNDCGNPIKIYFTKEEVANAIKSKEIFDKREGCHYQTCYEILP